MAKALGVSVEVLVGERSAAPRPPPLSAGPGPVSQVQHAFEEVRKLPKKQQRKVVEFVLAFLNEYKRKAS